MPSLRSTSTQSKEVSLIHNVSLLLLYEYFSISIPFADVADSLTPANEPGEAEPTSEALKKKESFESNNSEHRNNEDEDVDHFNIPNLSLMGILLSEEQNDSKEVSCCSVDSEDDLMDIPKDQLLDSSSPEGNG